MVSRYDDLITADDCLPAMTGRAWACGERIARQHVPSSAAAADATAWLMAALDAHATHAVAAGDFIVAGEQFAADANDRKLPLALKTLGIGAVLARSFGHFFLRNAINVGLPALVVEETPAVKTGDRLRIDIEAHIVANLSSGDRYVIRNLDDEAIAILRAGGIVAYTALRRAR